MNFLGFDEKTRYAMICVLSTTTKWQALGTDLLYADAQAMQSANFP